MGSVLGSDLSSDLGSDSGLGSGSVSDSDSGYASRSDLCSVSGSDRLRVEL